MPPIWMRDPRLEHKKAKPMAIKPYMTANALVRRVSLFSEMPLKYGRCFKSSQVTVARACSAESKVLRAPENRHDMNKPKKERLQ